MEFIKKNNVIENSMIMIYIYISLSFFVFIRDVPVLGSKIQLSEILFIPISVLALVVLFTKKRTYKFLNIDYALVIFYLTMTTLCFINDIKKTYLEVLGLTYFLSIYFVINLYYNEIEVVKVKKIIYNTVFFLGLTGILGVILTQMGIDTYLAWSKDSPYPYFEGFGRARGLSGHPNNLMTIISISWIILFTEMRENNEFKMHEGYYCFLLITGIAAFLTFSKMVVLLFIGLVMVFKKTFDKKLHYISYVFIGSLIFLYLIMTHFGFYDRTTNNFKNLVNSGMVSGEMITKITENFGIYANNYFYTKKAAICYGMEHQPNGIGLGQFVTQFQLFKDRGFYTNNMNAFEPHSLYTGLWVESGIIGLITTIGLIIFLIKYFKKVTIAKIFIDHLFFRSCLIILLLFLIDGLVTDVLFLRYYFIIFVLASTIARKYYHKITMN